MFFSVLRCHKACEPNPNLLLLIRAGLVFYTNAFALVSLPLESCYSIILFETFFDACFFRLYHGFFPISFNSIDF